MKATLILGLMFAMTLLLYAGLYRVAKDGRETKRAVMMIKEAEYDAAEAKAEARAANDQAQELKKEIRRLEDHLSEVASSQRETTGRRRR